MKKPIIISTFVVLAIIVPILTYLYIQKTSTIDCSYAFPFDGQGYAVCARDITSCPKNWLQGCPCPLGQDLCTVN
jgi:hypothetical protein